MAKIQHIQQITLNEFNAIIQAHKPKRCKRVKKYAEQLEAFRETETPTAEDCARWLVSITNFAAHLRGQYFPNENDFYTPAKMRVYQAALQDACGAVVQRVSVCGKRPIAKQNPEIHMMLKPDNEGVMMGRTYWHNLQKCGSVWNCPVCSHKILSYKAGKLTALKDYADLQGWQCVMLTLTQPHNFFSNAMYLKTKMKSVWRYIDKNKDSVNFKKLCGVVGHSVGTEVTYRNGFHPHLHVVFYGRDCVEYAKLVRAKWCDATGAAMDIQKITEVQKGDYPAKWDLSMELTKQFSKDSAGIDMFQLSIYSPKKFREYTEAFKGVHRVDISRNLAKMAFGNEKELTDGEIVSLAMDGEAVAAFSTSFWRKIIRDKIKNELIDVTENCKTITDAQDKLIKHLDSKYSITNELINDKLTIYETE